MKSILRLAVLFATVYSLAQAQRVTEAHAIYDDGLASGYELRDWFMVRAERAGGTGAGRCLWFNDDRMAKPWAGVTFVQTAGEAIRLSNEWLSHGFVKFAVNIGRDRYGGPGHGVRWQVKLEVTGGRYQAVQSQFVDRGRGVDEDETTWQEVLIPLSYWTELKGRAEIRGVSIQCREKPENPFSIDDVGFVRFAELPGWMTAKQGEAIAQPWVSWPAYAELPETLTADAARPRVHDGRFVDGTGRRTFVLNPYCREDPRLDVFGSLDPGKLPPSHELYDAEKHGWIYESLPTRENLSRLGFNSYSATMPGGPWWQLAGYPVAEREHDPARLAGFAKQVDLPFFVDTVCWPWTIGKPASEPDATDLRVDAFTTGANHWTPYRIIGNGRKAWLDMWGLYARRYRDAGVPVLAYELMNEPAYQDVGQAHCAEFARWLEERYGTVERLNQVWGATFVDWAAAADFAGDKKLNDLPGRFFDYDESLAKDFATLIADGVRTVNASLPDALVGVQPMGGYALSPRAAIWKHWISKHETVVLTPTGGGRWTSGGVNRHPDLNPLNTPIARAPIEDDLLLALAGPKMLYDNETYLRGQTARDTRNRLWEQVIAGLDGVTVFSWSKRGWAWWQDRANVQTEADKFPYSSLNPIARRTDALRGVLDFAQEVQAIAPQILPKPWGPPPAIGLVYDWANARRRTLEPELRDKTADYYAALKYGHWNMAILPSDQLIAEGGRGFDLLVIGGVTHAERELPPVLTAFVERGGVLVVGESLFDRDLYGHMLDTVSLTGVADTAGAELTECGAIAVPELPGSPLLPGPIPAPPAIVLLVPRPGTETIVSSQGLPVVTRRKLGHGVVYVQTADTVGYPLAKLLGVVFADAANVRGNPSVPRHWRLAEITDAERGVLATNVLLSRRSYETHHALLLMNMDSYDREVRVRIPGLSGNWRVRDGLAGAALGDGTWSAQELADEGLVLPLAAESPGVVLLERGE